MKLIDLLRAVESHSGTFQCRKIPDDAVTKQVEFHHKYDLPVAPEEDIPIGKLRDFYATFASLTLYHDPASNDAAFYIASPNQWGSLNEAFRPWLECVSEEDELLPDWIDDCIVIGEIPQSGNYLLMPRSGAKQGYIFEFEHDGFEFIEYASDIEQFVLQLLDPDASVLTGMASHMRFIEENDPTQWWIVEMRDNRGNLVHTRI